jgi:hypothetical protein
MIAAIFGYAIAVTLLVGLAAASVERVLAELGRPRRFAWLGALAVTLAFPPLSWLLAADAPAPLAMAANELPRGTFAAYAQVDWNTILVSLWVVTTTILLILYAAAWLRLALLAKRWPHEKGDAGSILVADDVGPAVLGIFRPRIVLPCWLMDSPAAVRDTVLAHELEHIAARDQISIVAVQVVTILLPWNLPLWWFMRRLRAAIEVDCDARVLRRGADPAQYAEVLLAVGQHRPASAYVAATLIEPVTQLERRIRIMLTQPRSVSVGRASTAVAVTVALAACATQLEPPVVITTSTPAAATSAVSQLEVIGELELGPEEGQFTMRAARLSWGADDAVKSQVIADRLIQTDYATLLEGNVRFSFDDGTSITASRALMKTEPDGSATVQIDDATIIRFDADGTKLTE